MDQKTIDILTADIKTYEKPGPGRMKYRYVKGEDVVSRLNSAFSHEWSSRVLDTQRVENQIIVRVAIQAGDVVHEGFGGAEIAVYRDGSRKGQPIDVSNSYKSALTAAIKKAAEHFGVGLVSDDDYSVEEDAQSIPVHDAPVAPSTASYAPVSASTTIKNSAAINNPMSILEGVDVAAVQKQLETMLASAASKSPPIKSLAESFVESKKNQGYDPVSSRQPEVRNPFSPSMKGEETINDIQLNALCGLAKMKKVEPEKAIKMGLPEATKIKFEELTRDEAKSIISALNKLTA